MDGVSIITAAAQTVSTDILADVKLILIATLNIELVLFCGYWAYRAIMHDKFAREGDEIRDELKKRNTRRMVRVKDVSYNKVSGNDF